MEIGQIERKKVMGSWNLSHKKRQILYINRVGGKHDYTVYISRRPNSWVRFRVQKSAILYTQIQMGVSQGVFIPSRASKYMLESKQKSFRKWKKFWSWATSFWSFGNFRKYAIYIYFIYTLWGAIVGCEVAQLQKKFFVRIH